jgi:outer membrane protein assembly factor BamB
MELSILTIIEVVKMKGLLHLIFAVMVMAMLTACGSVLPTVETTASMEWEYDLRYFNQNDPLWSNQVFLSESGDAVAVINARGFESIDSRGGTARISADRQRIFQVFVETTRGEEQINTEKISFMYVPHLHAVLEFNYGRRTETVTLIDLETGDARWVTEDLRWSMERYQTTTRAIARGLGTLGSQIAGDVASEILFPEVFVDEITFLVPELNAFFIKTFDGLSMVDLETGVVQWSTEGLRGGVAALMYDDRTESLVFVNKDGNFQVPGLQFTKQLARVDIHSGELVWTASYHGDLRYKVDGFGVWEDRELDIRLVGDYVILNFFNLEVYSMTSGERVWRTSTSADRTMDLVAPEGQIMNFFAFPVTDGETIYRVKHGNVTLSGIDVELEAFNLTTGERLWETGRLSRNDRVVSMAITGDVLVLGFGGNGSKEGVIGLNRATGEKLWQHKLDGNAVSQRLVYTGSEVWVLSQRRLLMVDLVSGTINREIRTPDSVGWVEDSMVVGNRLFLLGRSGLATFDVQSGELVNEVSAPRTTRLELLGNRLFASSVRDYLSSPVHIFDGNGALLGSVSGANSRAALLVSPQADAVFEVRNGKVRRYVVR